MCMYDFQYYLHVNFDFDFTWTPFRFEAVIMCLIKLCLM